jgi:hypothetical protein
MNAAVLLRSSKRKKIVMLGIALSILLVLIGARPAAAACLALVESGTTATSVETTVEPDGTVTPQIVTWTPYDSFKITSAANCQARMNSLKAMRPDITRWKCERRANITCPVTYYWFVMVGSNGV